MKLFWLQAFVLGAFLFLLRDATYSQAAFTEKLNYQGKLYSITGATVPDGNYDLIFRLYADPATSTPVWTSTSSFASLFTDSGTTITLNSATCGGTGYDLIAYTSGVNEATLQAGQTLWNVSKKDSAIVKSVNAGANQLCIYHPYSTWATGETVTNRVYIKNGLFSTMLGDFNNLSGVDFNQPLYLGVTVGSDAEMKPRRIIGTVPSALNTKALNGLTWDNPGIIGSTTQSSAFFSQLAIGTTTFSGSMLNIQGAGSNALLNIMTSTGLSALFVNNGGNVGIGTSTPTSQLYISGQGAGKATIVLDRRGGWGTTNSFVQWDSSIDVSEWQLGMKSDSSNNLYLLNGSGAEVLRVPSGSQNLAIQGNLGIGTTSPSQMLTVGASNNFSVSSTGFATSSGIYDAGILTVTGQTTLGLASSTALTVSGNTVMNTLTTTGLISANSLALTNDLTVANGGTGTSSTGANGSVIYSNGTAHVYTAAGAAGQILKSNGTGMPTWVSTSSLGIDLSNTTGTLPVNRGGTGVATLTGIAIGNGTSAFVGSSTLSDNYITDGLTISGGTIGANNISSGVTWTTLGTLTIGDGGDNIVMNANNWDVSSGGAATFVGVNSGTGLIQGTGGLTITGNTSLAAASTTALTVSGNTVLSTLTANGTSSLAGTLYANQATGRVGIGTTSPYSTFGIQAGAAANPLNVASSSGGTIFKINSLGQVSVGASNSSAQFNVSGVSETFQPIITGNVSVGAGSSPYAIFVQGHYAYSANYLNAKLAVVDITDPGTPKVLSSSTAIEGNPISIFVQGQYAYTANTNWTISILDVSNPNSPRLISTTSAAASTNSIYVQGRYAYTTDYDGALRIFDISNPHSPQSVSNYTVAGGSNLTAITIAGRYAYLTDLTNNTLHVVDVLNVKNPQVVGSPLALGGGAPKSIYVQGRYAYTVNYGSSTLSVVDIANPLNLQLIATTSVGNGAFPNSLYVQGRYAYTANSANDSMSIIDISTPSSPRLLGSPTIIGAGAAPDGVFVQGRYAYTANYGNNSLSVIDVGGAYLQQAEVGGLQAFTLNVQNNAIVSNDLSIFGGANIAQGLNVNGDVNFYATTTSFLGGKVGIGTTSPSQMLTVGASNDFTVTSAGAVDAASLTLDTALVVAEGGTGVTTLTGIAIGNGTSAFVGSSTLSDNFVTDGLTVAGGTIGANDIASGATWTTLGQLTIGDDGDAIIVSASNWDVTSGGAATFANMTSTGTSSLAGILYANAATGNVGIGTANPDWAKLWVNGSIVIDFSNGLYGYGASKNLYSLIPNVAGDLAISGYNGIGITGGRTLFPETSDFAMYVSSVGKVGIGTTSPSQMLTVGASNDFTVTSAGAVDAASLTLDTALVVAEGGTGVATLTGIAIGNGTSAFVGSSTLSDNFVTDALKVAGGNIGVNDIASGATWTTLGQLTIGDNGDAIIVSASNWDVTSGGAATFANMTSTGTSSLAGILYANAATGNVGIGTSSPTAKLDITAAANNNAALILRDKNNGVALEIVTGTSSQNNIFIGGSGRQNTSGAWNTALGIQALMVSTSSTSNTAYGGMALNANIGDYNTAIGMGAQSSNTTGFENTALGYQALSGNTTGTNNTAIGNGAGVNASSSASLNTFLGDTADVSSAGLYIYNSTAIGYNARVATSNAIRLGDTSINWIGGQAAWSNTSDRRLKENISDISVGLDWLMGLHPVEYDMINGNGRTNFGFIAQDVVTSLDGKNANIFSVDDSGDHFLSLRYTDFIAPTIKAIQEQQQEIRAIIDQVGANSSTSNAKVEIINPAPSIKAAVLVKQENANEDIASFRNADIEVMKISSTGLVRVVGTLSIDGRSLTCAGACPAALDEAVDGTRGDVGAEGKMVAATFENYCADGFVWVMGSAKYGTMPGFCVMATLARLGSNGLPMSSTTPPAWTMISQGGAQLACQALDANSHLLAENEWLTMAEQIVRNPKNDLDGEVAGLQLGATSTHYLANGRSLSELVGATTTEWTDMNIAKGGLPLLASSTDSNNWQDYGLVDDFRGLNLMPPYYLALTNGIGQILLGSATDNIRGFIRGYNGIFSLDVSNPPSAAKPDVGFRCAE